jgi:nicotinamidase-related amidase
MDRDVLVDNMVRVIKTAVLYGVPIVLSTVNVKSGQNQPTIPALQAVLPPIEALDRTTINALKDIETQMAIGATGRKKLVMTALWTEACLTFPTSTRCVRATRSILWWTPWVALRSRPTEQRLTGSGRPERNP